MKKLFILFLTGSLCFGQSFTLDLSFDGDGKVTTPIVAGLNSIYDIALQTDGKIVAVGYALAGVNYDMVIARYKADGSIDSSFNLVGFDVVDFGFPDDIAYAVAIQTDGKIIVAGSSSNGSNTDFALLRYNADGSLDNTFDTDGMVTTQFNVSYETAYDVAIQADGKIVAIGSAFMDTTYAFAAARYNTNGSLDVSFGTGGKVTTLLSSNDEAKSMAIQSDGKIVLGGTTMLPDFSRAFGVIRYNSNGTLDMGFNGSGMVITSVSPNNDFAQALALQGDGKIVVAGKATPVGPEQFAVVRYNTDGTLDLGWNGTGMLTTAFGSTWDEARAVIIQPDGKVVAGGMATVGGQKFAMARYNSDGTLDATFGTGGKLTTLFGSSASIWSMLWQPDGKILTAGYSGSAANYDFALARYENGAKPNGIDDFATIDYSLTAYPNPFIHGITIKYNLSTTEEVTLQLMDMNGKIRETFLIAQPKEIGTHEQVLEISDATPAGAYFLVLSTKSGKASLQVLKEK